MKTENLFYVIVILICVLSLISIGLPKDEPYYKVYVSDTHLVYVDGNTGDTIHIETIDWVNPSPLHQAIINDNE